MITQKPFLKGKCSDWRGGRCALLITVLGVGAAPASPARADLTSMAVGDFDGDGHDDLAIGVPNEAIDGDTIANAGVVDVIYSDDKGLNPTHAVCPAQMFAINDQGDGDSAWRCSAR